MSKVIKAAIFNTKPHLIETPTPLNNSETVEQDEDKKQEISIEKIILSAQEREKAAKKLFEDTKEKARKIEQDTEEKSFIIVQEAKNEAEKIFAKARETGQEEGYKKGYNEGIEKAKQEQEEAIENAKKEAKNIILKAKEDKEIFVSEAEEEITTIAMDIVEKILPQHFIDAPQVILPLVRKALGKLKDEPKIKIRVAPIHYDFIVMAKNELQSMLAGNATLEIEQDDSLKPGDCFLESPNGAVDAKLETQITAIKETIKNILH